MHRPAVKSLKEKWNAVAKYDLMLNPKSIATVTVVTRGAPHEGTMYLEAIPLMRGSDSFISAPHGIVELESDSSFQVQVANTTGRRIRIRAGELVGHLFKAVNMLKSANKLSETELRKFTSHTVQLATLIPSLDTMNSIAPQDPSSLSQEVEPIDTEHLGWGLKTTEPGPDQIYPSKRLHEFINVDPSLTPMQCKALYEVVKRNQATFSFDGRLGHLKSKVHIELAPGTKPISMPPYYMSPAKCDIIDKQINLWLSQDVIEETKSPWGAPVIIVHCNGKARLCINWHRLNKATIADQHPIPKQTDILQALSGFTQMEFNKESHPITAIRTHHGLHHFKCMPFGWRNRPPEFQRAMQEILSPFLWIFTLVYINDVVMYLHTFEDHPRHVNFVLKAIAESRLTLSPPKCHIGYQSIVVLGNKVSRLGLSTHHKKLKAIWELEPPKDRKKLKTFLGLAVYFSAYIPYFFWMATPLFKCLRRKETPFVWAKEQQKLFELLKLALVSAPVRGHPEAGQMYRLYTDTSDYAIAGALQQVQLIAIKDLKGTRTYKKLQAAHEKKENLPELIVHLSKEHNDRLPSPEWSNDWENTRVPIKRMVAYWSRVLAPVET
jgi:hypothetical protein